MVNPFRCKPIHKKAIFAVLTDDELQHLFEPEERAAIAAHVPWTRRVREGHTQRDGRRIDLPAFIRENRDSLVMKPNDEYGGKGVFIGWEMSDAEWEAALATALRSSYVVQEKVELLRQTFPELSPALALPRPGGRPRPVRVRGRGRGLPDAPLGHVARQRHLRRRPGSRPSSSSPGASRAEVAPPATATPSARAIPPGTPPVGRARRTGRAPRT